jgi:alpha-glucosidase
MDYTPGGFRNVTPEQFVPREILPMVQTTRGHALAMYVVYDSPFSCVSDSPDTYQAAAGFDFLSAVPTSWDETRVLSGQIGRFIVIARRKGAAWFIGAMTEGQARRMPVRLDFLGPGRFKAAIYADGDAPSLLAIERNRPVARHDVIHLALAANGGGAVAIYPAH